MSKLWGWAAAAALVGMLFVGRVAAQDGDPEAQVKAFIGSLHFTGGDIAVPEAKAHFRLGGQFRYLAKSDARRVLEELWGNPPDDSVLGMIVPAGASLASDKSWAVVVTYSDEGYVSDEDAAKIDYNALLKQLQDEATAANDERKRQGYETVQLVGWAVPPRYDSTSKKMYWAKELAFEGGPEHTLNYDVRVLGRHGFLSLNAVAGVSQLGQVREGMAQLLPMAEFDSGARYADYNSSTDKAAGYGLAALIGGGIAAKTGLLAKIGALLLAGKKFVVLLFAGLIGLLAKLFGRGGDRKGGTVR